MSGGASNSDRFEQIGQAWVKHTFGADQFDDCGFGCILRRRLYYSWRGMLRSLRRESKCESN